MSHHKKPEHHTRPYKIAAQTVGLVACLFIIIFISGTGTPAILKTGEDEWSPFIPLLALSGLGYVLTWYKEIAGTILMTAGAIMLLIFFVLKGDTGAGLLYSIPFILTAVVFLIHIGKRNELKRRSPR